MVRRHWQPALAGSMLAGSLLLAGCEVETGKINYPDADEAIERAFSSFAQAVAAGDTPAALEQFTQDYLHQGRTTADVALWLDGLVDRAPTNVAVSDLRFSVSEDRAVATYLLTLRICEEPASEEAAPVCEVVWRCRSKDTRRCGWLGELVPEGREWHFAGDDAPRGADVTLRTSAAGAAVVGGVYDPDRSLLSVEAEWVGLDESFSLVEVAGDYWQIPGNTLVPPQLFPDHPLPWELRLSLEDASGVALVVRELDTIMDRHAADLLPNGEILPPFTFTWQLPDLPIGGSEIELLAADQVLWKSSRVLASSLAYSGPTLTAGERYDYRVVVYDLAGNSAVSVAPLIPLASELVAPAPTSVSPISGTSNGGDEILVVGSDFLVGARVTIGVAECLNVFVSSTQISCTTPALQPGVHNLLVINPSGRVGVLERGFQVTGP